MNVHRNIFVKKEVSADSEKEERIRNALVAAEMKELEYLTQQEELHGEHEFSPEFEQKMEQLFQKSDSESNKENTKKRHSFRHLPRTAVAAVFAVMVIVIGAGIQTEAIPLPKFIYMIRKDKGANAYLIEQESYVKNTIEEKYEISEVPKGYKLQEVTDKKLIYGKLFVNEIGEELNYRQFTKKTIINVDEILENYKEMVFEESKYYVVERKDSKRILWYANGYQYSIKVDLPMDELVKMAKSIQIQ